MNNIKILDCTLRDGGYINNWNFGEKVAKRILRELSNAHIDIVECGFLEETEYNPEKTIFNSLEKVSGILPDNPASRYVAMIALGEKELSYEKIEMCNGKSIWGIRLSFHKHEVERAFDYAANLMKKGYQVFIQPVGTCTYSDKEFLELIERVNLLKPYSFYIVDTLGTIKGTELMRLFQLADNNLAEGIKIGFHSHNNLQLAFANAQELIKAFTDREVILDASVLGMGRGAGNLCTELITQYMNETLKTDYNVTALLEIVDNYLMSIKESNPWGYTIPYYIAAVHKCHPDYAIYLMNRQTLNVRDIERIIGRIPEDKHALYDKNYIEKLYGEYQSHYIDDGETIQKLREKWKGRNICVLAPGTTIRTESKRIQEYIQEHKPCVIMVNFNSNLYVADMIFVSNLKRFEVNDVLSNNWRDKDVIITSNIVTKRNDNFYTVNYTNYLNSDSMISDNAGLMLLELLKRCDVKKLALAGFDGFVTNKKQNYFTKELINSVESSVLETKTEKIKKQLRRLQEEMEILFITTSQYEGSGDEV